MPNLDTTPDDSRILLGVIINAHGIRGEVLVRSFADQPEDIAAYGALRDETDQRDFELDVVRVSSKGLVCRIAGVKDRNAAEALKGTKLYVERERLPEPEPGQFYYADLIGLKAIGPDGGELGTISDVMNFGASDILELSPREGGEPELIPFIDAFVPTVDLDQGTVTIVRPLVRGEGESQDDEGDSS